MDDLWEIIDDEEETQSDQEMPPAEPFDSHDEPETPAEVELEEEWKNDEPNNDSRQQPDLGPVYMVSGTRDNPPPEPPWPS